MVEASVKYHLAKYRESGTDLILGEGRMVGRRTLEVKTRDGTTRRLTADRLFLNLGTHAIIPDTPSTATRILGFTVFITGGGDLIAVVRENTFRTGSCPPSGASA
jgi:pyruvate/2-oxoglutarate dehydrogenase complex dihydrolipoamide dehydrogenase (E3) component